MKAKSLRNNPLLTDLKRNLKRTRGGFLALLLINTLLTRFFMNWIGANRRPIYIIPTSSLSPVLPLQDDITYAMQWVGSSLILYLIFSFFMVLALFGYLYDRGKLDLYHALPISRRELLLSRFLTIAIQLFTCGATQIVMALLAKPLLAEEDTLFALWPVILSVLISCVTGLALACIFIFCAVSAHRTGQFAAYAVGLTMILSAGAVFLLRMPQQHLAGFYWNETILGYFFPTVNFFSVISGSGNQWLQLFSMVAVCAVLIWASVFVYTRSDLADRSSRLAARVTQLGVQLLCASLLSFLMGAILTGTGTGMKLFRANPVLAVVVSLPVSLFFTIVCERFLVGRKRGRKGTLLQWGVVSAFFIGIACLLQSGVFGFAARVPDVEEVESIVFSDHKDMGPNRTATVLTVKTEGKYLLANLVGNHSISRQNLITGRKNVELRGEEAITAVLRLHRQSLDFFYATDTRDCKTTYTVTYRLKNGKELTRSLPYSNNTIDSQHPEWLTALGFNYEKENQVVAAYRQAVSTEEFLRNSNPLFGDNAQKLAGIWIQSENLSFFTSEQGDVLRSFYSTDATFLEAFLPVFQRELLTDESLKLSGSTTSNNRLYFYIKKPSWTSQQTDAVSKEPYGLESLYGGYDMGHGESYYLDCYVYDLPDSYADTIALIAKQRYP